MKRPPGLWILLSAGVLWLSLQDVYGIRATALIFGKSSTSTTTEETASAASDENSEVENGNSTSTSASSSSNGTSTNSNSSSPTLTGIPQIDYIWDPNLPKELNGYNLSEYPFYERVPAEEIDFKCDGLHDGFYASVPHKCQVYHHCLFGTRYDFLCANYTAFDQKTFICHFVSEVDCVNSKKFWHRNDALYQAASTTTAAPVNLRAAIYTTASPDGADPITPLPGGARRPAGGGGRRPYRPQRRRPQFEYYDDEYYDEEYYDERPARGTRGRKRYRPRPRPLYDDEYEEYEDEKPDSKRSGARRRPYKERRRNKDRRKSEYDDDDDKVDDRFEDEDFIAAHKREKNDDRRKHPIDAEEDDYEDRDRKRTSEKRRPSSEKREGDRKPSRKGNRRPAYDEYDDELPQSDDSRSYEERPRKNKKGHKDEVVNSDGRPIIKPSTGTIYDRPRVAPRINLPVPKNAADKYAYKSGGSQTTTTTTTTTAAPASEEDYDDEEYQEPLPKRSNNRDRRPLSEGKRDKPKNDNNNGSRQRTQKPKVEEIVEKSTAKPKYGSRNRYRPSANIKRKPAPPVVSQEYEDEEYLDEDKEIQDRRPSFKSERKSSTTTTSTTTTTTTTTTAEPPRKHEPVMRIIKRPFLPSRGGSPYSPRGLQPVGLKAVEKQVAENYSVESKSEEKAKENQEVEDDYIEEDRNSETLYQKPVKEDSVPEEDSRRQPFFKPSPVLLKVPIRPKYTPPSAEAQELIDLEPSRQQPYKTKENLGPRTTQKPKVVEKDPLDINDYDVTLNDALNPTLPNLPVRSFPTGFSSPNDYSYNAYSRPRYVLEPVLSPTNQNFAFPHNNKVVRSHQRYESSVPQQQYRTISEGYRQHPQGQTQAIYSGY